MTSSVILAAKQKVPVPTDASETESGLEMVFSDQPKKLLINGSIEIEGAAFKLLWELATANLEGAGKGLSPEDYPLVKSGKLVEALGMTGEQSLRMSINRTRSTLKQKFASAGLDEYLAENLIENLPWHGYRLNPDFSKVFIRSKS